MVKSRTLAIAIVLLVFLALAAAPPLAAVINLEKALQGR
jgi:hypothetical protein